MNRHFRRGDSSKWGRTSTAIRENVRRTGAALASRQYFLLALDVRNPVPGVICCHGGI